MIKIQYCKKCVYPNNAVNLEINTSNVCSACGVGTYYDENESEFWAQREKKFEKLVNRIKKTNTSNYDCLIPVSGGKDSYYQTHVICKKYNLKPLLMTYHGNNFLPEGDYNRDKMREVFDADHIIWGPSINVLKELNRVTFKLMGDMNWQNHCGIVSAPIQIAVKFNIPIIIWGETPWDISGMHDLDDFVEFSAKSRHEHDLRGFEWYDLLKHSKNLSEKDMLWAKYPTDEEILGVGVRGIYIGNFFKWEPNINTQMIKEQYNWKEAEHPFERTYRRISNLDDRYENGIHDLMKFIKFGYGRASDHASKDVRSGDMTRDEAIEMVRKYDSVISSDLYHWLNYVDMEYDSFWKIADTFRDPRVWWIDNNQWWKDNIWGEASSYGKVYLNKDQRIDFNERQTNIFGRRISNI
jgi:N-acetyl sugar amidotransferase